MKGGGGRESVKGGGGRGSVKGGGRRGKVMCVPQSSHQVLEHEVASESTVLQQRLEVMEDALGERERELAEARERIESLTDELVISQGKVDWQREGGREGGREGEGRS